MALAETAFAGGFGMEIDLRKVSQSGFNRNDFFLFSESQSCSIVTIDPERKDAFKTLLRNAIYGEIGGMTEGEIFRVIGIHNKIVVETKMNDLKEAWQKPLRF